MENINLFDKAAIKESILSAIDASDISDYAKNSARAAVEVKIVNRDYSREPKFVRVYIGHYGDRKMFSSKAGGVGLDIEAVVEYAKKYGLHRENERESMKRKEAIKEKNAGVAAKLSEQAGRFRVYPSVEKEGRFSLYIGPFDEFSEEEVRKIIAALA